MKRHRIIIACASSGFVLALCIPMRNYAMDLQQTLGKPQHLIEADETARLLEAAGIPGITKPLTALKATFPQKSFLEIHQLLLNCKPNIVQELTPEDKTALVTWYQKIYVQLARMSPEEAAQHPLRFYKTRIYALALRLHASKEAAKQWLKAADCYSDEEKELDAFVEQGETAGYRRNHYYAGKHSVTIQKNRENYAEELTQTLQQHQQVDATLGDLIKRYDEQIQELLKKRNALLQGRQQNCDAQQTVLQALKANGSSITIANTVYSESLQSLHQLLQNCCAKIKHLEQEIATLKQQTTHDAQDKETRKATLLQKCNELSKCQTDQAAIKRDIDLLTNDYTFSKKLLWKLSGWLSLYPVEETPGNPQDAQSQEEQKDPSTPAAEDTNAQQQTKE